MLVGEIYDGKKSIVTTFRRGGHTRDHHHYRLSRGVEPNVRREINTASASNSYSARRKTSVYRAPIGTDTHSPPIITYYLSQPAALYSRAVFLPF